jgi:hypothetical protein
MNYYAELNFGAHDVNFQSQQNTIEIQIKVTFEESFPFKELDELMTIVENADQLERLHLLPKALKVVKRMKTKFSNSLSPDYETWLIKVDNVIARMRFHWDDLQSAISIPEISH